MLPLLFIPLLLSSLLAPTRALITEGSINFDEEWAFLARFCFLSLSGSMDFTVSYTHDLRNEVKSDGPGLEDARYSLLLYFDDRWELMRSNRSYYKNCLAKTSLLDPRKRQILTLSPGWMSAGCELTKTNYLLTNRTGSQFNTTVSMTITCSNTLQFAATRDRWWYVGVSGCTDPWNQIPIRNFSFRFDFRNNRNDSWRGNLSADQFYIPEMLIGFLAVYVIFTIATLFFLSSMEKRRFLHTILLLFVFSVAFHILSLVVELIQFVILIHSGRMKQSIGHLAHDLAGIGTMVYIIVLVLMAKGLGISRGRISSKTWMKMFVFFFCYFLMIQIVYVWEATTYNQAEVLYLYESEPGIALLILRGVAWLWFSYATFFTVKNNPQKRKFYTVFWSLSTIWFGLTPLAVVIATKLLEKWMREKIVFGISQAITLIGHAVVLGITWPSQHNSLFPFHVRTTQIEAETSRAPDGKSFAPTTYGLTSEQRPSRLPTRSKLRPPAISRGMSQSLPDDSTSPERRLSRLLEIFSVSTAHDTIARRSSVIGPQESESGSTSPFSNTSGEDTRTTTSMKH